MDLIDKIKTIIKKQIDPKALFDISYDVQKNISGYIATETLNSSSIEDVNNKVWSTLEKGLSKNDFIRIMTLFTETFEERLTRLEKHTNNKTQNINLQQKIFLHRSKDGSNYYGFLDFIKTEKEYHSFYLVINETHNFLQGQTFIYSKEVIDYMEVNNNDVAKEIYINAFQGIKTSIRIKLMELYEEKLDSKKYGKNNTYTYVYENFEITPIDLSLNTFNKEEAKIIKRAFADIFDCTTKQKVLDLISFSEKIKSTDFSINSVIHN